MASVFGIKKNQYQVRSISLPPRSHPSTVAVEEELNKIKSWETTPTLSLGSIQSGLDGLANLYLTLDDLLNMASTQEVLSINKSERCLDELLDGSVKLLDMCGITRDLVLQIKERVQVLQSALRRRKGDSSIEISVQDYTKFMKKLRKDAKKLVSELKQMDNIHRTSSSLLEQDNHHVAVIRVLREVNVSSSFMVQSVLSILSASSSESKGTNKWSIVSRLVHKGAIASEEKLGAGNNELASVDAYLRKFSLNEAINSGMIRIVQRQLESLDVSILSLDNCLECLFRRFIKTRSSLLNIISQ